MRILNCTMMELESFQWQILAQTLTGPNFLYFLNGSHILMGNLSSPWSFWEIIVIVKSSQKDYCIVKGPDFPQPYCRKHVVFGKVVKGMEVIKKMELVGTSNEKPTSPVKIIDCGEMSEIKAEDVTEKEKGNIVNFWMWKLLGL